MRAAAFTLGVTALVFVGIGLGFLITPVSWANSVEIVVPTAMARTDLRATYGGFDLMFGLFLARCAHRPEWHQPGLMAAGMALAGFAGSRLLGFLIEGSLDPFMQVLLAIEVAACALCVFVYRREYAARNTP